MSKKTTAAARPATSSFELKTSKLGIPYVAIKTPTWSSSLDPSVLAVLLANPAILAHMGQTAAPVAVAKPPVAVPAPVAVAKPPVAVPAPVAVAKPPVAVPADGPVSPALLAEARDAKLKGAHLFRSANKLRAALDAKQAKLASKPVKATSPAPVPVPAVKLGMPTVGARSSNASPAPTRTAIMPEPARPRVLTLALGENNVVYEIMSDGTYRIQGA